MTKFHIALILLVSALSAVAICYVRRDSPVLYTFATSLRDTEGTTFFNPFRDHRPEVVASKMLEQLRNGQCKAVLAELPSLHDSIESTCNAEAAYPIRVWKLAGREDSETTVEIRYDVLRTSKKGVQTDPLWVTLERTPSALRVRSIETVY